MKKLILLPAICWQIFAFGQNKYWQQEVNYIINVSLNEQERSLNGFLKIQYTNHSPDTLQYIWINLWPNAYKNDLTSFSDQLLQNGRTDFYFADPEKRGYINQLDFRIDGTLVKIEDHPQWQDVIKLVLPSALAPGRSIAISTLFHEKLPNIFSSGGHEGLSFQITQWYPKPAVYDKQGWHPMPYLDQGGFYEEFGNYEVSITLPKSYVVAATGILQNAEEKYGLENRKTVPNKKPKTATVKSQIRNPTNPKSNVISNPEQREGTKTLLYKQNNIHDFVWFADQEFIVDHDTLLLNKQEAIDLYAFHRPGKKEYWENPIPYAKTILRFYGGMLGPYPYNTFSFVQTKGENTADMIYSCIAGIKPGRKQSEFQKEIIYGVGRQWFYSILGPDTRTNPWLEDGLTTYFSNRFIREDQNGILHSSHQNDGWLKAKLPEDPQELIIASLENIKEDQPINTPAEDFTPVNYRLFPSKKASDWMRLLDDSLGPVQVEDYIKSYYDLWQFKHPGPEDFQQAMSKQAGRNQEAIFELLSKTGPLPGQQMKKVLKPTFLFSERNTEKFNYINIGPAAGYNLYDQFMIGALIHNFTLPPQHFRYLFAPLYATGSKQFNGLGLMTYSWFPAKRFSKITLGVNGERFSSMSGTDSSGKEIYGGFYKIAPSLRFSFMNRNARSSLDNWVEFRTYLIGEKAFDYVLDHSDSTYFPIGQPYAFRYLNQLSLNFEDDRALYPYRALFQIQQSSDFYRIQFTGNYFFNYPRGGGLDIRFFAADFGYIGGKTSLKEFQTTRFQPKLTAVRGDEDYTYGNYFVGRDETTGFASQQIMMRDGSLKLRTDLFQGLQGRSDQWITAMNFNTTLPNKLLPFWIPVKIFFDLGTYADAWGNQPPTSRFLYVGGVQVSLLKNLLNIYIPIFYSADFENSLKTVPDENTFWKRISFSIDVQNFNPRKLLKNLTVTK
ncbi:MAG: M1 family metallopeptidase [Chitinophagales bacterium]